MRILVTGATGLLGTDLCRRLSGAHEVTGWARHPAKTGFQAKMEPVDVTDEAAVRSGLKRSGAGLVVHAAAMTDVDACETDPDRARRVNGGATRNVAAACSEAGAVLIAIGTDYVFDGESPRPYRETDATRPVSVYGRSKLEAEEAALSLAPRVLIVRVSGLFGSARDNFVSMAARHLRAGKPVQAVSDQVNSPSYTADLAEEISRLVALLENDPAQAEPGKPLHGLFHLANRGGASRMRVAQEIARAVGAPASLIRQTTWASIGRPARRPPQSRLDCGRFARQTGRRLRPWEEAVRAFLSNTN